MDLSRSLLFVGLSFDTTVYPFCYQVELPVLLQGWTEIYIVDIYQYPSILRDRYEMPDHVSTDISARPASREIYFYKAIYSCIRFLNRTYNSNGLPGQVRVLLAELVNQLLGVGWLRYIFIEQRQLSNVAVAQGIEPVFYLVAATVGATDMEVELIITNTERPSSRHHKVCSNGAAQNEQDHHQGDQFVVPYSPE